MNRIARAVTAAAMLAIWTIHAAQAATVEGATDAISLEQTSSPELGKTYYFNVRTGPLSELPSDYATGEQAYSRMFMTISGQGVTTTPSSIGTGDASNLTFSFKWIWAEEGPATLTFSGYLDRYMAATPSYTITGQQKVLSGLNNTSIFIRDEIGQITWQSGAAAALNPTPVPIGGTLPLMLSALGLGALVMRRRARRAAAV